MTFDSNGQSISQIEMDMVNFDFDFVEVSARDGGLHLHDLVNGDHWGTFWNTNLDDIILDMSIINEKFSG